MSVSTNIKYLREKHEMTQEQLAEKLDVARSTVTQWERGWSNPRMGMIQRIAGVFGVSVSEIVSDNPTIPDNAIPQSMLTSHCLVECTLAMSRSPTLSTRRYLFLMRCGSVTKTAIYLK